MLTTAGESPLSNETSGIPAVSNTVSLENAINGVNNAIIGITIVGIIGAVAIFGYPILKIYYGMRKNGPK